MSLLEATALAALAGGLTRTPWSQPELLGTAREASNLRFARNNEVVQADAALNQAFWCIFALLDPLSVPPSKRHFAGYYSEMKSRLVEEFNITSLDAAEPSKALAMYLNTEMRRLNASKRRPSIPRTIKLELLDLCDTSPYCWYCGHRFSESAINSFTGEPMTGHAPELPLYLDFTAPRGILTNDARIEVDHLHAFSRGGGSDIDNLKLACGWCNRHKSALSILYDAPAYPRLLKHPRLGDVFTPVPFWVVRVLGTRRSCESPQCTSDTSGGPLVIAPWKSGGAMVPGNLAVFCEAHDPLSSDRLVARHRLTPGGAS
jgi:HNH endonuclease